MKPEQDGMEEDNPALITGDVIGDTAYSERFVLRILIKFANLDSLKEEMKEKIFEEDLCMLWDMATERDVVLFLQKHEALNLFSFALPMIDSPRIMEIMFGIIANMCCQKIVVNSIMRMDNLLNFLMDYINTDDTVILIQLLRLINSSLFLSEDKDIAIWMDLFKRNDYSNALYFMLKNSTNKDLLITAFENFNTVFTYCNIEIFRADFYTQFVRSEAIESMVAAVREILLKEYTNEEIERLLVINIQILVNLISFHDFVCCEDYVFKLISLILHYYKKKVGHQKQIDYGLLDVIDSMVTILNMININESCVPDIFFWKTHTIWKILCIDWGKTSESSSGDNNNMKHFCAKLNLSLGKLMCLYMEKCDDSHFLKIMDDIGADFDTITNAVNTKEAKEAVIKRAENYRTRLQENGDS